MNPIADSLLIWNISQVRGINMISIIEVEATSQGDGVIPFTGPFFRAAVLRSISSQDPLLAKALELSSKKIFVEALRKERKQMPCGSLEEPVYIGSEYRGSIIIFNDNVISDAIKSWIFKKPTITIKDIPFKVTSYMHQEINILDFIQENPCRNFRLRFLTPTCFKRATSQYCYLYPNPRLIVSSLASAWNALSPKKGPETRLAATWADLSVVETGYELCTTKPVEMSGEKTFVGFMGWVNYKVIDHPEWHRSSHEEMAKWLATYLMFGELIGVGYMRNMGFGRIKFEVKRK